MVNSFWVPNTTAALSLKGLNPLAIPSDYVACFGSRDAAFTISTGSSYVSAAVVLSAGFALQSRDAKQER